MLELKRTYHKTVLDSAHASFFFPPPFSWLIAYELWVFHVALFVHVHMDILMPFHERQLSNGT